MSLRARSIGECLLIGKLAEASSDCLRTLNREHAAYRARSAVQIYVQTTGPNDLQTWKASGSFKGCEEFSISPRFLASAAENQHLDNEVGLCPYVSPNHSRKATVGGAVVGNVRVG